MDPNTYERPDRDDHRGYGHEAGLGVEGYREAEPAAPGSGGYHSARQQPLPVRDQPPGWATPTRQGGSPAHWSDDRTEEFSTSGLTVSDVPPRGAELARLDPRWPMRREPPPPQEEPATDRQARRAMPLWQELPLLLFVAFCLAVLIRTFLLQAFYIPSGSMEQTLLVGDRVLVNKIVYDVRTPERGEVVVFRGTNSWAPENFTEPGTGFFSRIGRTIGDLVGFSRPGEKDFIKRVIGVPGDRVSCCDPNGRIYVNGKGIDEPYLTANSPMDVPPDLRVCKSRRFDEVLVPPGQLFVMGDHRIVSQDSRCQGTVPVENVIGRAFVVIWPGTRWDTLSVPETFDQVPPPVASGVVPAHRLGGPVGMAAVALPLLVSLAGFGILGTTHSGRKWRWRPRTLRR